MKKRLVLTAMAAVLGAGSAVAAEGRRDEKIDKAAADIVAGKMGDLREGFDFNEAPVFVPAVIDDTTTNSIRKVPFVAASPLRATGLDSGLAQAEQRKVTRTIF